MNYETRLQQLRAQRASADHQIRVLETATALEELQEIGQIAAYPKGDRVEFPMPYDAGFTIHPDPLKPTLVLEGGAGPSGWGSATTSIDFIESAVKELMESYGLQLQVMNDEDHGRARELVKQLLWLEIEV